MNFSKVFLGLFLVIIAVSMIIASIGNTEFWSVFQFMWPAFLVLWGLTMVIEKNFNFIKLTAILVGVIFLIKPFVSLNINSTVIWAVLILVVGVSIIFRQGSSKGQGYNQVRVHDVAIFGGKNIVINDKFEYAETVAIFGGSQLNLWNAKIDGEATVDATAIFGGVEIIVPESFKLVISSTPIFGGIDNKTRNNNPAEGAPVLHIKATTIFGGIEIKN